MKVFRGLLIVVALLAALFSVALGIAWMIGRSFPT